MAQKKYINTDKFGNPYQVIGCKPNDAGYSKGYIELAGSLYKLEPSISQKEGTNYWIRVTKVKKRNKFNSM